MHKARTALLATTIALAALSAPQAAAADRPECDTDISVPYRAGEDGYHTYRIPAVITTPRGTVLAFAEGRLNTPGDTGNIDLVVKRSTDGGCTWGPLTVVHERGPDTAGNPAPVVTADGRVVLLSVGNAGTATERAIMLGEVSPEDGRRVFVQYSDDDGRTFTPPREITDQTKHPEWRWYATGPGHAVRLTHGPHTGRLVVPANHSIPPEPGTGDLGNEPKHYGGHSLYSDDNGDTWHIGFTDDDPHNGINANESTAAQLPDGRLYLNTRDQHGTAAGNRADAYSSDGGTTLDAPYAAQETLVCPVVQGSVLQLTGHRAPLIFTAPGDPARRVALTVNVSHDHGTTWRAALTLSGLPAAYSDPVQLDRATVGVLYETGEQGPYESITFRRVPIRQITHP